MSFIIKTHSISRRCCHQVLNNLKCYSKLLTYEKNLTKTLAPIQHRFFSDKKKEDGLNKNLELIYHGKLSNSIKYVKIFSITTSLISLSVQPWLISKTLETGNLYATAMVVIMFGGFAFITPLVLHMITNRYTIDLHYDRIRDVYIATVYTIFITKKMIEFTVDDISKPAAMQLLTTCFVKGKAIFFDYSNFTDVEHYSRLLGYDKPMDFMLETPNVQSVNATQTKSDKKNE